MPKRMKFTTHVLVTEWNKHGDHEAFSSYMDRLIDIDINDYACPDCEQPVSEHECIENSTQVTIACPGSFIIEPVRSCERCGGELFVLVLKERHIMCQRCQQYSKHKQIKTGEIYVLTPEEYAEQTKEEE